MVVWKLSWSSAILGHSTAIGPIATMANTKRPSLDIVKRPSVDIEYSRLPSTLTKYHTFYTPFPTRGKRLELGAFLVPAKVTFRGRGA